MLSILTVFVRDLFGAPPSDAMLVFSGSSGQR